MREKDVTIYDIANELNMSSATVSRALKDDPVVSKKTRKRMPAMSDGIDHKTFRIGDSGHVLERRLEVDS